MSDADVWQDLQKEVSVWATHNFGRQIPPEPMLGMVEELGEFFTPQEQDQTAEDHKKAQVDAIGDMAIYALNLLDKCGVRIEDLVRDPQVGPKKTSDRGIVCALAVMCRAVLKNHQGIGGMDHNKLRDRVRAAAITWYGWALYQCEFLALPPLLQIVRTTWMEVCQRDWRSNPQLRTHY